MQEQPRTVRQEILDEIAIARRFTLPVALHPVAGEDVTDAEPPAVPLFRPHEDKRYALADLATYHDQEFLTNAYLALMGRAPDPGGREFYLEQLRSGRFGKIDVLGRLLYCDEGRRHGAQVAGLGWRFRLSQLFGLPLIGYATRSVVALATLPRLRRQLLATENYLVRRIDDVRHDARQDMQGLGRRIDVARQDAQEYVQGLERRIAQLDAAAKSQGESVARTLSELNAALSRLRDDFQLVSRDAAAHIDGLRQTLGSQVQSLVLEQRQLARRLAQAGEENTSGADRPAQPPVPTLAPMPAGTAGAALDAFYVAFEARFRGDPELVRERLSDYLPLIAHSPACSGLPVLDIGCGRGEWLQLLGQAGYRARGLDLNESMVEVCHDAGLDVICADALAHLGSLPSGSLAALTGFHIVEHLPLEVLVALFDEAIRVLAPGGVLIVETPNPENILVGACNFYFDPTHVRPLVPGMLQFIAENSGFPSCSIMRLHPCDTYDEPETSEDIRRLFGCGMDYALIARKL